MIAAIQQSGQIGLGLPLAVEDSPEGGDGHQQYEHTDTAEHQSGSPAKIRVKRMAQTSQPEKQKSG